MFDDDERKTRDLMSGARRMAVEWRNYKHAYVMIDQHSVPYEKKVVTFVRPQSEIEAPFYLLDLSPIAALTLLDWLVEQKQELERLAILEAKREEIMERNFRARMEALTPQLEDISERIKGLKDDIAEQRERLLRTDPPLL